MEICRHSRLHVRRSLWLLLCVAGACLLLPRTTAGQALTGALIVTVRDDNKGVLVGATVQLSSPALIGGAISQVTNDKGVLYSLALPPGRYLLHVELRGFTAVDKADIDIVAGETIEHTAQLKVAGGAESIIVEGAGSRIETRNPGLSTRFGPDIPARRASFFGALRAAPGISPTSPASGTATTVSSFGSGTNENQFLVDGENKTCPCNGVARSEAGISFIQGVHIQSIGASAEYGNFQGAVINVVTKQGGERFLSALSYSSQTAGLTSRPVVLPSTGGPWIGQSGFERAKYRDLTTNLGGPLMRDRLWFFVGYEYLRDHDSQPASDPAFPRTYEQDKVFVKLTWKLSPRLLLVQSFHGEYGLNPERPTDVTPFDVTTRSHISVPATSYGHLTHTLSANTLWDVRVGRFVFTQEDGPHSDAPLKSSRFDRATGVTSGGPPGFVVLTIMRTTAKATLTHYRSSWLGASHLWKVGGQLERGEHHGRSLIPTGVRYADNNGAPVEKISRPATNTGGVSLTGSLFATDAVTIGNRLTLNLGARFDHSRAIHQDLHAVDADGRETEEIIPGGGTLYTWNIVSPRLGLTMKLTADGRTMVRASFGRYSQGVLTGELQPFHPGAKAVTTTPYQVATDDYTGTPRVVNPKDNLKIDLETRAPRTDELSIGLDREIGPRLSVAIVYVRKDGANFIGWEDTAGKYDKVMWPLSDGRSILVHNLDTVATPPPARRFFLTNQDDYSMTYNGLVLMAEKRQSNGWQAFGSYTFSRVEGLQASSGTSAAGVQASTVSPPDPLTFGRDPNDLTNARGRLPNDRPHMFRVMGNADVPRTGLVVAANLQHFSGKPWAESALVSLRQGQVRVLLEPRGSRRLSSQTLLDFRVSRTFRFGARLSVDLMLDVFNALNDTAEEGLATDRFDVEAFGQPIIFMDPRRAMIGVRLNLGR